MSNKKLTRKLTRQELRAEAEYRAERLKVQRTNGKSITSLTVTSPTITDSSKAQQPTASALTTYSKIFNYATQTLGIKESDAAYAIDAIPFPELIGLAYYTHLKSDLSFRQAVDKVVNKSGLNQEDFDAYHKAQENAQELSDKYNVGIDKTLGLMALTNENYELAEEILETYQKPLKPRSSNLISASPSKKFETEEILFSDLPITTREELRLILYGHSRELHQEKEHKFEHGIEHLL